MGGGHASLPQRRWWTCDARGAGPQAVAVVHAAAARRAGRVGRRRGRVGRGGLVCLARRDAAEVRRRKGVWALVIAVNIAAAAELRPRTSVIVVFYGRLHAMARPTVCPRALASSAFSSRLSAPMRISCPRRGLEPSSSIPTRDGGERLRAKRTCLKVRRAGYQKRRGMKGRIWSSMRPDGHLTRYAPARRSRENRRENQSSAKARARGGPRTVTSDGSTAAVLAGQRPLLRWFGHLRKGG